MGVIADELVARFEPWLTPDLEDYLRAIASMFDEVELLAFETDEHDGWTILFDPDRAPAKALPYLAQFVGERLPTGIPEAAAREWIKDRPNSRRGTPESIFLAAQRRLTGDRLVSMRERDGVGDTDDPHRLRIVTYTSQTPNPEGTLEDIQSVVPADVELIYETASGQSWQDVRDTYTSWRDLMEAYDSWAQVATDLAGVNTFRRPEPT